MLKIEITSADTEQIVLRLSGKLSEAHQGELERIFGEARRSGRRIGLDLEAVTLADRSSVVFLADCGAELVRCPAFLREWIRAESDQRAHGAVIQLQTSRDLTSRETAPVGRGDGI